MRVHLQQFTALYTHHLAASHRQKSSISLNSASVGVTARHFSVHSKLTYAFLSESYTQGNKCSLHALYSMILKDDLCFEMGHFFKFVFSTLVVSALHGQNILVSKIQIIEEA